ncbi:phosphoesterase [Pseudonocardia sulfidoxydans NBRC 16205]|uniref:Phosphoesterase n=1 Tax=Pseudonocardia sulfidoxydans NBRC 16205 TaxID=1223511 RepID=A0A511DTQ5_9PSEU|nr:bifunctional oligoribonuclease/PAP phosphatase NrnA [Pseudonocardia sulfidoxydans]GEL26468.1 phosphoesterase [Pseudonocardia sulfidoxydans NBRC 16205]
MTATAGPPSTDVASAVSAAAALLATARDVTLVAHVQPDADSLGSALALGVVLARRGARVRVSFAAPAHPPESLRPLDALGLLVAPDAVPAEPELLVMCDTAAPERLGSLLDRLTTARCSVLIDHHASNPGFGDVRILDPSAEATVVLVHRLLAEMGAPIDGVVATCLYAGLVTDTVGFRTAGPAAHRMAAELLEAGVDVEAVLRPINGDHPFTWLDDLGGVLQAATLDAAAAGGRGFVSAVVPAALMQRYRVEEVDGVVDQLRTTSEADVAAVLKQVGPRRWSVSMRSRTVDVATAAVALGGGGHPRAAGVTLDGDPDDVLARLRAALSRQG